MIYLTHAIFNIKFVSDGRISSNFPNTFRGGFGAALRDICCAHAVSSCGECDLNSSCAYSYLFETHIPETTDIMRKYPNAPHPLLFAPQSVSRIHISDGFSCSIRVTLIGKATSYLPHVFLAMQKLGETGLGADSVKYSVESVKSEDGTILYHHSDGILHAPKVLNFTLTQGDSSQGAFTVRFITPLRLQVKGRIASSPSFHDIVAALCRRIMLLSYFHCGGDGSNPGDLFLPFADEIVLEKRTVYSFKKERFSARQKQKIPMDGFMGTLTFKGNYGFFLPLLRLGEYIHIGKDTIFGFGKFQLHIED